MKAVILAGGLGSRLSEETTVKPKPMVEIGGKPILWHIMKIYSAHGVEEFVVALGYKGYLIKEWFANYALHSSDVTFDMRSGEMEVHRSTTEPWRVTLVETGAETKTGGRLKRVLPYVADQEAFCFTYGDGLADLDVHALAEFHTAQGALATLTAVQPVGRFGALDIDQPTARVRTFQGTRPQSGGWVNGGFFVLSPGVGEYIDGDDTVWEEEPVRVLAAAGDLAAYRHTGFWMAMDTLRDKQVMQALWEGDGAPWKTWG